MRLRVRRRSLMGIAVYVCAGSLFGLALPTLPATAQTVTELSIAVSFRVRGTDAPTTGIELRARCSDADGAALRPSVPAPPIGPGGSGDANEAVVPSLEAAKIDRSMFPALSSGSLCSVRAVGVTRGAIEYSTEFPARADGTRPDAQPGLIAGGSFRSAATAAGGRVSVTLRITGDLLVRKQVEGVRPNNVALWEFTVRCEEPGINGTAPAAGDRTFLLGPDQTRIITGILTGSRCRVTERTTGGAAPSILDNSDSPNDGVVLIPETSAACWELRTSSGTCRSEVTVTNRFDATTNVLDQNDTTTSTSPSTTVPDDTNNRSAATAAPAVAPAPAVAVDATPAFTG